MTTRSASVKDASLSTDELSQSSPTSTFDDGRVTGRSSPSSSSPEPTLNLYGGATVQYVGLTGDNGLDYLPPSTLDSQNDSGRGVVDGKLCVRVSDDSVDPSHFRVIRDVDNHRNGSRPIVSASGQTLPRSSTPADIFKVVAPHGPALVSLYFRLVHPSFPILSRERTEQPFLALATSTSTHQKHANRDSEPAVAPMVAGLLIVAMHWWSFDPSLCKLPRPDITVLRDFIENACKTDVRVPRLVTVQTFLFEYSILTSLSELHPFEAWAAVGSMVSTSQNLGLHQNPERWKIQPWEITTRKRLWWAVFVTDKWLSHSLGRSSHIHHDDWNVPFLEAGDFEEVNTGSKHFMAMASLSCILSDTLDLLYSTRTVSNLIRDISATLNAALPLLERCDAWLVQLPPELSVNTHGDQMMAGADDEEDLNPSGSLHLAYFVVRISLHRAILRCKGSTPQSCRSEAVRTMQEIAHWTKTLSAKHILALWFSHSRYNFSIVSNFMLALLFTSRTQDEFTALYKILQTYRWNLRVHSNLFPTLVGSALHRVDDFCQGGVEGMMKLWKNRAAPFKFRSNAPTVPSSPKLTALSTLDTASILDTSLSSPSLPPPGSTIDYPLEDILSPTNGGSPLSTGSSHELQFQFEDFMMFDNLDGVGVQMGHSGVEHTAGGGDQFDPFAAWGFWDNTQQFSDFLQFGGQGTGKDQNQFNGILATGT